MKTNRLSVSILLIFLSNILLAQNYEWAFTTNQYDRCNDFSDGLAIVKKGFKRGYINREGQVHLEPQFNIIDAFAEGTASAGYTDFKTMDSESGFINRAGEFVRDGRRLFRNAFRLDSHEAIDLLEALNGLSKHHAG